MKWSSNARNNKQTAIHHWVLALVGAVTLAVLNACGGGMSSMSSMSSSTPSTPPPMSVAPAPPPVTATTASCTATTCGSAVMTITDAAGDFLTYQVNLVSLQLKKSDGTLVETLPATTTVDLVQLVNLSEIISARQIPPGEYVSAMVTVDYTRATIMADDGTGNGVALKPVDSNGGVLGQLQLTVVLDNKNDLKINAAKASRIAFDFNLLASNMVNLSAKTDTVTPILVASVVAPDNKSIRVRGELVSTDTANSDYTVQIDPFQDRDDDKLSPLVVHTTGTTSFEINGAPFAGAAGLQQLASLPAGTLTVAFGTLQTTDQTFTATAVLAGTSVAGVAVDHLSGNVIARSGNTLTVHNAQMDDRDGGHEFVSGNTTVTIASATAVTVEGQTSPTPAHTIAEISVGSLIDAFGASSGVASSGMNLDATASRIRLNLTSVQGVVRASGSEQLTLNLNTIDHQSVSRFNFSGTGTAAGGDTNPGAYSVATGKLDLSPFTVGSFLLSIGFVSPFGSAPPDFNAVTLINGSNSNNNCNSGGNSNCMCSNSGSGDGGSGDGDNNGGNNNCMCSNSGSGDGDNNNCTCNNSGNDNCNNNGNNNVNSGNAELDIDWGNSGTRVPFKVLDAMHLDLDVTNTNIGDHHQIEVGPSEINIEALATDPSIEPTAVGMTLFSITGEHGGATQNFQSFADFETALAADLNGTTTALRMTAEGQYNAASSVFTAQRISVLLSN